METFLDVNSMCLVWVTVIWDLTGNSPYFGIGDHVLEEGERVLISFSRPLVGIYEYNIFYTSKGPSG